MFKKNIILVSQVWYKLEVITVSFVNEVGFIVVDTETVNFVVIGIVVATLFIFGIVEIIVVIRVVNIFGVEVNIFINVVFEGIVVSG